MILPIEAVKEKVAHGFTASALRYTAIADHASRPTTFKLGVPDRPLAR